MNSEKKSPQASLIVSNTLTPSDLPKIQQSLSDPIHWVVRLSEKKLLNGSAISPDTLHFYEDSCLEMVQKLLDAHQRVAVVTLTDEPIGLNGIPVVLDQLTGTFAIQTVWVDNLDFQKNFLGSLQSSTPSIRWGKPFTFHADWRSQAQQELMELSSGMIQADAHLGWACLRGLKANQFKPVVTDAFMDGKTLSGGMLLALGMLLAQDLRKLSYSRIGVVLPPGLGAFIANLACTLANKIPVNLNFTAGRASNESAIRQAKLQVIITSERVEQKLTDFPWTTEKLDIGKILKSLPKWKILFQRALVALLPCSILGKHLDLPMHGGDVEAGLLFTSGSSGEPKGVPLTHRNILSNIAQINSVLKKEHLPSILACLPVFHSFGFTVTLWWPMVCGPRAVTYVSPLEVSKLAEVIEKFSVALMVTTPTFLRTLMKKASATQLQSLKMIVTGAEKLPLSLLSDFESKFSVPVCEGYGMTEGSPVIGVNLPELKGFASSCGTRTRAGSIGRPLVGVAIKVTHQETGEPMSLFETGTLWFKGQNIFSGYLDNPQATQKSLREGWYNSGDVGRMDAQGFLHIEGRQSRFSKIAGEMVPHGTVEQMMLEICMELGDDQASCLVMGVLDQAKGESLVALTTSTLEDSVLRQNFNQRGLPNLWIPKKIHRVESIPTLASGKVDLQSAQKLVNTLAN